MKSGAQFPGALAHAGQTMTIGALNWIKPPAIVPEHEIDAVPVCAELDLRPGTS